MGPLIGHSKAKDLALGRLRDEKMEEMGWGGHPGRFFCSEQKGANSLIKPELKEKGAWGAVVAISPP